MEKISKYKKANFLGGHWAEGSHQYELRTIFENIPLPLSWPCEVNFHEALAYCHYKAEVDNSKLKYRLLTEAEFVSLTPADNDPVLQKRSYRNIKGQSDIEKEYKENFNFIWSSPKNVDSLLLGNTWHWLTDQFNPLDNFSVNSLYDDFSTPCFDGKHRGRDSSLSPPGWGQQRPVRLAVQPK